MDIELKRLEQVMAVVRTGSISRAAQELHMTQPALSRSIATLEERYGIRIFERGRGGAALTAVGKSLVLDAEQLLRQARTVDHNFKLYRSGEAGHLAFGMGPLLASLVLPAMSVHFLKERPQLQLRAVTRPAGVLYQELMEDRVEILFLGHELLNERPQITSVRVGQIEIALIVRAQHPLAGQSEARMEELAPYPMLISAEPQSAVLGGAHGTFVCDNYHILRETTLYSDAVWVSSPALVREDIAAGRLWSLSMSGGKISASSDVYMVSRQGKQLSPGAAAIHDFTADYLSKIHTGTA